MWKQLRALLPSPQPDQLTISSHGQETCGIPFEQSQRGDGMASVESDGGWL